MPLIGTGRISPNTGVISYPDTTPTAIGASSTAITPGSSTSSSTVSTPVTSTGTAVVLPITLTGDLTGTGYPIIAATLSPNGVTPGTYTYASIVVDSAGRIKSATNNVPASSITAGTGLSGGVINSIGTFSLANTTVTPGTYTFSSIIVDAQGRIESASNGVPPAQIATNLTGDVTGTGLGTFVTTLAASGVTAGTYSGIVVNTKGLITAASPVFSITSAYGTQANTIQSRFTQVLNVSDFGLCGSGVSDSASTINAAFAYIRTNQSATSNVIFELNFPNDFYTCQSPINITGLNVATSVVINGHGSTIIAAFNGGILFDCLNSRFLQINNFNMSVASTYAPLYGLVMGQIASGTPADCHVLTNISISGNFRNGGAVFIGTENTVVNNMRVWTNPTGQKSAVWVDGSYSSGVTSSFVTITLAPHTLYSFEGMTFNNLDCRINGSGGGKYCVMIAGTSRLTIRGYMTTTGTGAPFFINAGLFTVPLTTDLTLDVHCPSATTNMFVFNNVSGTPVLPGFTYKDDAPGCTSFIFTNGAIMMGANITVGTPASGSVALFDVPANYTVSGNITSRNSTLITYTSGIPSSFVGKMDINGDVRYFGNTGPSVITNTDGTQAVSLQTRFSQSLNVTDFGLCGTGVADSSTAINAALAYIRTNQASANNSIFELHFPNDYYTILSPINATGLNSRSLNIRGHGSTIIGAFNGGIVFDCFNSRFLQIDDLNIATDGTHIPAVGLAVGIINGTNKSDCHVFDNVWINGIFSTACAYFFGTETSRAASCHFWNSSTSATSYALIVDGQNHFGIASTFATQTLAADTAQAFNQMIFDQPDCRALGNGFAIWIGTTYRHSFIGGYVHAATAIQAVVLWLSTSSGGGGGVIDLTFDMHQGTATSTDVFLIAGPQATPVLYGLKYHDHGPLASNSIFKCAAGITGVTAIGCLVEIVTAGTANCKLFDTTSLWTYYGDIIVQTSSSMTNLTPNVFQGRTILNSVVAETLTNLTVSGSTKFGTYTAGAVSQAGYVTITDAGGTSRRLLVG